MLRQILRLRFVARQCAKTAETRFFSTESVRAATKSIRKNSKNRILFSSKNPDAPTYYTGSLCTRSFKKYSTSNNSNNDECFEDLMTLGNKSIQARDNNKALEYISTAMERSKTPDQFLAALTWKLSLQLLLNKTNWDDDFLAKVQKFDPESVVFSESWERILGVLSSLGSYDSRCTKFFDKAFKAFPNNFIVIMKKAEVMLNYGLANEAKEQLKRAIEIDPHKSRPWALLWRLHPTQEIFLKKAVSCPDSEKDTFLWCEYAEKQILQDGNIDAGMESLKKAVADKPILPGVESALSKISSQLQSVKKDSKSAEKVVRLWIEESPKNGSAWSILGSISNAQQKTQEAEKCYRKAIELDPSLAAAWFNLGNMVAPKEGIPLLIQALKLNPDLHSAQYRLAMYYRDLQQYEKALESVNKALKLQKHPYYIILKGSICASLKRYREEFLIAREMADVSSAVLPHSACVKFEIEERFEEGLVYVREQIKRDPKSQPLHIHEATFLEHLKRYDEALKASDKAIEIARQNGDQSELLLAMKHKSTILARSGNIIEAKKLVEFLQQQDDLISIYPRGIIHFKEGKFDEALAMFEKYAHMTDSPEGFEIYRYARFMDIAATYEAKGDLVAAEKYYNIVLEINPDAKSAAELLKEIKERKPAK